MFSVHVVEEELNSPERGFFVSTAAVKIHIC